MIDEELILSQEPVVQEQTEVKQEEPEIVQEQVQDEKKGKYWARIRKINNEKREIEAELEAARLQNLELQNLLNKSLDVGAYHYETSLSTELEKAENNLADALESGDAKAVAKATREISLITSQVADAKKLSVKAQAQPAVQHIEQDNGHFDYEEQKQRVLVNWLYDNPELLKDSPEYDENLVKNLSPFISKLENKMHLSGKADLIGTPVYFEMIEEYMDNIRNKPITKQPNKHFGSVNMQRGSEDITPTKITLSPSQKAAAAAFGMTEERYIEYLNKYGKK